MATKRGPKRGPGQPKAVGSAEELAELVDRFIAKNELDNSGGKVCPPDDYEFCKFVGISSSTLDNYRREEDKYPGYLAALKKLVDYREHYYLAAGLKNPKLAGVTNFALKQRKNGGYTDKQEINLEAKELKVITGEGMPEGSFE